MNGTFLNDVGGSIHVDQTAIYGIYTEKAFTNKAAIHIGANESIGFIGLWIFSGTFTNDVDSNIHIDRTSSSGIRNDETFTNNSCARVHTTGSIDNQSTFTNDGFLFTDFNGTHSNTGTFTNSGVIEDFQGAFNGITIDNQGLIIAPVIPNTIITNALQIGTNNDFTASTDWYSDENLTTDIGDYDQTTNTFTSAVPVPNSTTFYMEVTDNDNPSCSRVVAIKVALLAEVPTLSEWGLLNLALLLMICGTLVLLEWNREQNRVCGSISSWWC